ncbi:hypothetical protein M0804_005205 [Polistes exclamans]|nr:hypothetical protein M0804_005205 [Polistes exclamans]
MVAAYLSLFCSISEKPLEYWHKRQSQTGCIRKILDTDLLDNIIEIQDIQQLNISKTSISCPSDITKLLNVELPVLVIILKHFGADCRFQIQVIDTNKLRHHFQFYTGDSDKIRNVKDPVICRAKIQLQSGWNKIELNLKTLTETAFKCHYVATQRLEICANCRLRRIYFLDRHYKDSEISSDLYQGFLDLYMLKWGIHQIDNATQTTNLKQKKSNLKNNNYKVKQSILNTNNNANSDEMYCNKKINHSLMQTQSNDCSKLINNIRMKSNNLIDEFFKRQNPSSLSIENFKDRTIIKSYVVPTFIKKLQKKGNKWDDVNLSNWNNIMEKTKDKSSLPLSSDTQKNHNETFNNLMEQQKDIFKNNNMEEKWTYRYLCEGKQYLKTNDAMESNTSDVQNISNQYNSNFFFPISHRMDSNLAKTADIQRKIRKNRTVKSH